MKRVLCFGDSNTWGYIPGSNGQRYSNRWTRVLKDLLGPNYEVIEEGLNSRTLTSIYFDPLKKGKTGYNYLLPCMESHNKFDVFVLMLGTNELKNFFNNSPEDILDMIKKFIEIISNFMLLDGTYPRLIVSSIPLVDDRELPNDDIFSNTKKKSEEYCQLLKSYCENLDIEYLDNTDLKVGIDGIHLTEKSHYTLATRLNKMIKEQ